MARIEIAPDPRIVKHRDPVTGDLLAESPIVPNGCSVRVNGITSAYCDGPGMPVNVIRRGLAVLSDEIKAKVVEHYEYECECRISVIDGV